LSGESAASQKPTFWAALREAAAPYVYVQDSRLNIPARVLLVDDHPAARRTARAVLEDIGVNVAVVCGEAENGKQAIDKVRALEPDIVLLDIGMPEMDGVQTAYAIRRMAPYAKIVFFTINDSPEAFTAAKLLGAEALVSKSSPASVLVSTIQKLVTLH
jgi:DNA-binding NarL/FixJ family response regulator